jgi:hypothetical protein
LPPGTTAAAVCGGFGFRALRANPGATSSRSNKADNVSDESANRDGFNCKNVDREKLDLGFMEYVVFLLVETVRRVRQNPKTADHHSGPIKTAPELATENNL